MRTRSCFMYESLVRPSGSLWYTSLIEPPRVAQSQSDKQALQARNLQMLRPLDQLSARI